MIPRDNVISSFLSPNAVSFVTAQSMRPIHFVRLPSVLIPGFNGTCSDSLECGDGVCAVYSCSLRGADRCQPGQRSAGICYPNNDIGYCIRRSGGTILPSSFSSCEPEGVACDIGDNCPGSQRCILGRCKQDCHILSDPPNCAENQICLGSGNNTLSERGVCVTLEQDDAGPASERCIAGTDLVQDLPFQLLQRFDANETNDATFGTSINSLWAVGLSENIMQNGPNEVDLGEFGWCLPELTQSTQNSLTEDQSRLRLRQLFDGTTPWHEIFTPGRLKSAVTLYDNYWGFNHAYLQGCHALDVPINLTYPRNFVALRIELIDLNGDGFDEFRVHFGVGSEATTASIWRCYDGFGDRIISNCTP